MIYFKDGEKAKNIKELIVLLYSGEDRILEHFPGCSETFSDEKLKKRQCSEGKDRSFDDLLEITKTCFPVTIRIELQLPK